MVQIIGNSKVNVRFGETVRSPELTVSGRAGPACAAICLACPRDERGDEDGLVGVGLLRDVLESEHERRLETARVVRHMLA